MLEIDWQAGEGWKAPQIHKYQPLAIDPAASALHYALEVRTSTPLAIKVDFGKVFRGYEGLP